MDEHRLVDVHSYEVIVAGTSPRSEGGVGL